MQNEIIVVRSQRNLYDHALRTVGVKLVEVGLPDRYSGAGVRDAEAWEIADAIIDSKKILLLKPNTYMNSSGHAVKAAKAFYKIPSKSVLVFHDELDLEFNKVRVKRGGSHAGHNGLKSIHNYIGDGYGRVRLGIGHPGDKSRVTSYVLQNFTKDEMRSATKLLDTIAKEFPRLLRGDDGGFMSRVATVMSSNALQPGLKFKSPHTIKES